MAPRAQPRRGPKKKKNTNDINKIEMGKARIKRLEAKNLPTQGVGSQKTWAPWDEALRGKFYRKKSEGKGEG